MRRALLAMLMLFPAAVFASEKPWFQGTFEQAQAMARSQNKTLMLKFYADW